MSQISDIFVSITDTTYPEDESYVLQVDGSINITGHTALGVLRALETLYQLTSVCPDGSIAISELPILIKDSPRFQWRGLMIDTSRHFLTTTAIKRMIDALEVNKMNILHWHIVDAQSFPFNSKSLPKLVKGAYAPYATYSVEEVKEIVQYGLYHGVRVIPEIDMPGHAASWGVGYPNIVAKCPSYSHNINNIPLNPALEETYSTIETLFTELTTLFPDAYVHVGGDEVVFGCWMEDPSISSWMQSLNYTTGQQVYTHFETRLFQIIQKIHRRPVVWQEAFESISTLPKTAIVDAWKDVATVQKAVSAGYDAILSHGWYLDKQLPAAVPHYEWEDTWKDFYTLDPLPSIVRKQMQGIDTGLVLGGEACMWGEQVDDANIDSRIWPRASAVAERLWSPESVKDVDAALPRLSAQRCRLNKRGIGAGPVQPGAPC